MVVFTFRSAAAVNAEMLAKRKELLEVRRVASTALNPSRMFSAMMNRISTR